ncbi:hypothetical protein [Carnimonas bestiolae]|uniref:hypothetical protein n=1 Tax=Carnimonas bestiolae TaxID=3402172 RepID=UPI003EDB6C8B
MRFLHASTLVVLTTLAAGCVSNDYPPDSCGGVNKTANPEVVAPKTFSLDPVCLYRSVFDNPGRQ